MSRKRYTLEEKVHHIKGVADSDSDVFQYCQDHGIAKSTLYSWLKDRDVIERLCGFNNPKNKKVTCSVFKNRLVRDINTILRSVANV